MIVCTPAADRHCGAAHTKTAIVNNRCVAAPWFVILVLVIVCATSVFGLAACAPFQASPEELIVGKWENPEGGTIFFYEDLTGFIPGDEEQSPPIPSVKFSYYFPDETYLAIKLDDQNPLVFEVKLEKDRMTWLNQANQIEFVYEKTK